MQTVNTFEKGMNMDSSYAIIGKDQYLLSENLRYVTDLGNSSGSKENIIGNTDVLRTDLSSSRGITNDITDGSTLIGSCLIRDDVYGFVYAPVTNESKIIQILPNFTTIYTDKFFTTKLNFNINYKIKAVGRYESPTIQRIYWVDGLNLLRSINVKDPNVQGIEASQFDILPNTSLVPLNILGITNGGALEAGKYQYAYQFITSNGVQTAFSSATNLISISGDSGTIGSNRNFKGDSFGTNSGKIISLALHINQNNLNFDRIRVISIKYDTLNSTPSINIITDKKLPPASSILGYDLFISDTGIAKDYLGTLTTDEYTLLGTSLFTAKEIETKNDYLFVGNISDINFDVTYDARAYRFFSSTHTTTSLRRKSVLSSFITYTTNAGMDPDQIVINGATSLPAQFNAVISTHNCINIYNYNYLTYSNLKHTDDPVGMIYQSDGTTLGGEGVNIKYTFSENPTIVRISDYQKPLDSTSTGIEEFSSLNDYSNFSVEQKYMGYQRNEIYRFGIVFFNGKGVTSTTKWIGDIKFPKISDEDNTSTQVFNLTTTDNNICANVLGITFTLSNLSSVIAQGATSYKIVRVRRTDNDRTIIAQGLTSGLVRNVFNSNDYCMDYKTRYPGINMQNPVVGPFNYNMLEFISPEINFNKNLVYRDGDIITTEGYVDISNQTITTLEYTTGARTHTGHTVDMTMFSPSIGTYPMTYIQKVGGYIPYNKVTTATTDAQILSSSLGLDTTLINADNIANRVETTLSDTSYSGIYVNSLGGTKLVIATTGDITNGAISGSPALLCNYTRPNNFIYGGADYAARQNSVYEDCSNLQNILTTSIQVFGGDTYISMFDYLSGMHDSDNFNTSTNIFHVTYFPIETNIDLRYRSDYCYSKSDDPTTNRYIMQETAGSYSFHSKTFVQKSNLYIYNGVYSQENSLKSYFSSSELLKVTTVSDTKVANSAHKINGENIDSFMLFPSNDYLNVDSTYGEVIGLKVFRNNLYFFQPRGFGTLSVNTREMLNSGVSSQLVLGTGGVLDRYDYISTNTGNKYRFGLVTSPQAMYWIDSNNKYIYKFDGSSGTAISLNRLNSLFNNNTFLNETTDIVSTYDSKFKEVLFGIPYKEINCDVLSNTYSPFTTKSSISVITSGSSGSYVLSSGFYLTVNQTDTVYFIDHIFQPGESVIVRMLDYTNTIISYIRCSVNLIGGDKKSILLTIRNKEDFDKYTSILHFTVNGWSVPLSTTLMKCGMLAYSELIDSFDEFYTYYPLSTIQISDGYLTSSNIVALLFPDHTFHTIITNSESIWRHNIGSRNSFYEIVYPSTISYIVNDNFAETKVFDSFEYFSKSENILYAAGTYPGRISDIISTPNTLNLVRVSNDYQSSDYTSIVLNSNLIRKERGFMLSVPRNIIDTRSDIDILDTTNYDSTRLYRERMRDKYMKVDFVYNISGNNEFSLPYIKTNYRISKR